MKYDNDGSKILRATIMFGHQDSENWYTTPLWQLTKCLSQFK